MSESQTHRVELLRYIDATAIVSGALMVRLHSGDPGTWPSNTEVSVSLENVSPAPDDPATLYADGDVLASAVVSVTFNTGGPGAPVLKVEPISGTIAGFLRCMLTITSDGTGQIDFTIGINVVGRDG